MEKSESFETGCCPRFNPEPWDDKELNFSDKLFMKDHVKSVFHIPLNFGKVMTRDMAAIDEAGAKYDGVVLSDEKSAWGSDVYVAVDKNIENAEIVKIEGTFYSKVFEGPYKEMKKFVSQMDTTLKSSGRSSDKKLFYYVYCPECAKAYGKNYIVILARLKN